MTIRYGHHYAHFCAIYAYKLHSAKLTNDEIAEITGQRRPYIATLIRRGKLLSKAPKVKR